MIVQKRGGGLRLVRQHDHALASGDLAAAWTGLDGTALNELDGPADPSSLGPGPLNEAVILAVALHDLGWRVPDRVPRLNRRTGLPYDFVDFPPEFRFRAVSTGIDRVEELHPYAAVLVSLHHSTLGGEGLPSEFDDDEQLRRAELLEEMGAAAPGPKEIHRDISVLRLLDRISLILCATPPEAERDRRLDWLETDEVTTAWADESTLEMHPFPFGGDRVTVEVPHRDLEGRRFRDRDELEQAWHDASEGVGTFTVAPGGQR